MKRYLYRGKTARANLSSRVTPVFHETLFIAACSLIGYLCTLFYYQGILNFYKMPLDLVKLDVMSVIKISVVIIAIFLAIFFVSNLLYELFVDVPNYFIMYMLRFLLIFTLIFFGTNLVTGQTYPSFKLTSIITVSLMCLHFATFCLSTRKIKGIRNKFGKFNKSRTTNLIDYSTDKIGIFGIVMLLIAVISISFSQKLGHDYAKHKINYQILSADPDLAVVLMSEDRIVCVRYDKVSKKISNKYTVIAYGASPSINLETGAVGPLRLQ